MGGGIQGTLPFAANVPIRLPAQIGIFHGLSDNSINSNQADGFNYFETRTGLDFHGKLIQTLVFGKEGLALKLHVNEGLVTSAESGTGARLLLATGIQVNVLPLLALGMEVNSRTAVRDIAIDTDPLWITPSAQILTPYSLNLALGADVSLSREREGTNARALEPYRLFGGIAFSFDTQFEKRRLAKKQARMEAMKTAARESQSRFRFCRNGRRQSPGFVANGRKGPEGFNGHGRALQPGFGIFGGSPGKFEERKVQAQRSGKAIAFHRLADVGRRLFPNQRIRNLP
jgi:hypothetical protein